MGVESVPAVLPGRYFHELATCRAGQLRWSGPPLLGSLPGESGRLPDRGPGDALRSGSVDGSVNLLFEFADLLGHARDRAETKEGTNVSIPFPR